MPSGTGTPPHPTGPCCCASALAGTRLGTGRWRAHKGNPSSEHPNSSYQDCAQSYSKWEFWKTGLSPWSYFRTSV